MEVSKHALKQVHKRLGVPMKAVQKLAEKAWGEGKEHKDFKGSLHRYLSKLYHSHDNAVNAYRILDTYLFFFTPEGVLVTAYQLPDRYKKQLQRK